MTTYVKFMMSSYQYASRNRREVAVAAGLGFSVVVSDVAAERGVHHDGQVTVHHRRRRPTRSAWIRRPQILIDFLFLLPNHLRKYRADCISCHDLIALSIGWISTLTVRRSVRPHLVYDSHEYELGRNTRRPRSALRLRLIKWWEGALVKRCAFTISVNDTIADKLYEIYDMDRPLVIRSTPPNWVLSSQAARSCREQFCESLGVDVESFLAMYHGGVLPGRGIEMFLKSLQETSSIRAIILGNGEKEYIEYLQAMANELGIADRVTLHPAVPIEQLRNYVSAVDVGVMPIQAVSLNHLWSLPNKLFENVQSLTPVIGSAYPELSRVINDYGIGLTVDPTDPSMIARALERIRTDSQLRLEFASNLQIAKQDLCWERERCALEDAYTDLLCSGGATRV